VNTCSKPFNNHCIKLIQVSENLDVCLAITFALSGRGVQAMLRGICGAVRVALLSATSWHFLSTIASSNGRTWSLVVFSMIGLAIHSLLLLGKTTLKRSSPLVCPLEAVAWSLLVLALWSRAASCVRATMPLYQKCCRLGRYFVWTLWYTSKDPVWQLSVNCWMSFSRFLSNTSFNACKNVL